MPVVRALFACPPPLIPSRQATSFGAGVGMAPKTWFREVLTPTRAQKNTPPAFNTLGGAKEEERRLGIFSPDYVP